jgi:hypothetical protein
MRRLIDAFNRRDVAAVLAGIAPEMKFESSLVERKTYRGHAGLGEYLADLDAAWSEWATEDDELVAVATTASCTSPARRCPGAWPSP